MQKVTTKGRKPRARGPRPAHAASTPNLYPVYEAVRQFKQMFLCTIECMALPELYAVEGELCDNHIEPSRVLHLISYATMFPSALAH